MTEKKTKEVTPMTAATAETLSRETIAAAIRAVDDEKRLQEIRKRGLSDTESNWITLTDTPRVNFCTEFCTHAPLKYPGGERCPCGTVFPIHVGERPPKGPSFRPATEEEIAGGTREDAAHFAAALGPVTAADALVESVRHEDERAQREVEAAARRKVDLAEALKIAEARAESARSEFEKFCESRGGDEWKSRVADLVRRLETPPPAPALEAEPPRTVADIERRARGSDTAPAYKMGRSGPESLPVTRS